MIGILVLLYFFLYSYTRDEHEDEVVEVDCCDAEGLVDDGEAGLEAIYIYIYI